MFLGVSESLQWFKNEDLKFSILFNSVVSDSFPNKHKNYKQRQTCADIFSAAPRHFNKSIYIWKLNHKILSSLL